MNDDQDSNTVNISRAQLEASSNTPLQITSEERRIIEKELRGINLNDI